jgi:hypothetical protein
MKPKVYVETSVLSYLAARASRDAVTAGRQSITRLWWEAECGRGDRDLISRRQALLGMVSLFRSTGGYYRIRREVERIPARHGYHQTTIYTPEELV